jgi:PEP-CTERM motif-containing protein
MLNSMSHIRSMNHAPWLGAAAAAMLSLATAAPATARPISTDSVAPGAPIAACALSSCAPSDLGGVLGESILDVEGSSDTIGSLGVFNKLYIYTDGIVSFGKPLPAGATFGDPHSLGDSFAAPGFADYTGHSVAVEISVLPGDPDASGLFDVAGVRVYWIIDGSSIFALDLELNCAASSNACFDYGAGPGTFWYPETDPFLVHGALVGFPGATQSGALTINAGFDVQGTVDLAAGPGVPEPSVWALLLLGFGALGATLRRRRSLA